MSQLTLGQQIAARRKLLGLSQEALSEKLNVSRQSVSKWESDVSIPEVDKLIALSKLFEVNIGWLLGVEAEPTAQVGFSDEQLKTVEELIARYHPPKKRSLWKYVISVGLFLTVIAACIYYSNQIHVLDQNNKVAIAQISTLTTDNERLKEQLDEMNALLTQQSEGTQLLTDFFKIQAHTDEYSEYVTTRLYMKPKIYQENNAAYLSIQNPSIGFSTTVTCTWNPYNQVYIANYTIPAADGYKFSFLLVNEHGYEEENLLLRDPGFACIGTYCKFYLDTSNSQFARMQRQEPFYLKPETLTEYSFNVPIYSPHIFAENAVAYKDIRIILKRNGTIIWEKSYLDAFHAAAGGAFLNAGNTPIEPMIELNLANQVEVGDTLELVLTAETANSGAKTQTYYTLLDYIKVTE